MSEEKTSKKGMLKTLGAYIGEYKKDSILTPVWMLFEVLFEMLIPLLMGAIVDNAKKSEELSGYG